MSNTLKALLLILVLVFLIFCKMMCSGIQEINKEERLKEREDKLILNKIEIKTTSWFIDNGMAEGNFIIKNNNENINIKDINVICIFYSNSKAALNSYNKTFYDFILAKGKKSFKKVNLGFVDDQVKSMQCTVSSFDNHNT